MSKSTENQSTVPINADAATPTEFQGMPDGSVPKDIRAGAEAVIHMRKWIKSQKEELKQLEETLLMNMAREGCPVAIVIYNDRKHRIFYQGAAAKIVIKEEGLSPSGYNGQAPKAG